MNKRARLAAIASLVLLPFAKPVFAQGAYPERPITLIVPFSAGGQTDIEVRSLCTIASRILGQPIIIQNRPGAVGSLGATALAAAASDGYLLSSIPVGVFRQPYLAHVPYDPTKDLTYVMGTSGYTFGFVVRSESPWKTLKELIDYARANPGKLRYATLGVGSTQHNVTERIASQYNIEWIHVPFKGTAENNVALQGGHVDFTADGNGWASLVDSGRFRLLATWGAERSPRWPDVPTLKELGFNIVESSPYGIAGPKNLPAAIVGKLHAAFKEALFSAEHQKVLTQLGQPTIYRTPAEFKQFASDQMAAQKEIVERFKLNARN